MFKKYALILAAVALLLAVPSPVGAQASAQTWTTSITYYTPSASGGTLQIDFYAEGSDTKIPYTPITLVPHAAGSLYVGGVSGLGTPFKGTAVLSSDVPVIATGVHLANNDYPRMMYNGFTAAEAATPFYMPTVLKAPAAGGYDSLIAIQNTESFEITARVRIYAVGATTPTVDKNFDIKAQSNVLLGGASNLGSLNLPAGFSGSMVVTATKKGVASTPGKVVVNSQEISNNARGAYAFEGLAAGANTVYMGTMLYQAGTGRYTTYYAIQNADPAMAATANVTVTFYNTAGAQVGTYSTPIGPGGKQSVYPSLGGVPTGTSGSAVIESTGAPVIAIGKVQGTPFNGMATAFVGANAGATKIAAPYIRFNDIDPAAPNGWQSYIAIMNVGDGDATNIQVKYYEGAAGTLKATHSIATATNPLPKFIKRNSDPKTAGALTSGLFGQSGGSIEISSDQPLVVVVRVQRVVNLDGGATTIFAEDYNGLAIP